MVFWSLTALDLAALALFLACWLGYAPVVGWSSRRHQVVASARGDHRRAWMFELLGREVKIADATIIGQIMSTASFFASTTVILIGALIGVVATIGHAAPPSPAAWLAIDEPSAIEIKLVLVMVVAAFAFQSFTWAIRQANFAAIAMGAAPPAEELDDDRRRRLADHMAEIITAVGDSYDSGIRSYYFALAAVTWVVSPILMILATIGVVAVMLHRLTHSRTAVALDDIARVRAG